MSKGRAGTPEHGTTQARWRPGPCRAIGSADSRPLRVGFAHADCQSYPSGEPSSLASGPRRE